VIDLSTKNSMILPPDDEQQHDHTTTKQGDDDSSSPYHSSDKAPEASTRESPIPVLLKRLTDETNNNDTESNDDHIYGYGEDHALPDIAVKKTYEDQSRFPRGDRR
jgi:hypothetical protein